MFLMVAMLFALVPPGVAAQVQERISPGKGAEILPIAIHGQMSFEDAVKIAEEFLRKNSDGTLTLNMPRKAIEAIGKDLYTHLQAGITQTNIMISMGYLDFDRAFNANITEKYHRRVATNISTMNIDKQLKFNEQFDSFDVFSERNTTIASSAFTGVTKVVFFWWGYRLYLDDELTDLVVLGNSFVALWSTLIPGAGKFIAVALGSNSLLINHINRHNRGIVAIFWWTELRYIHSQ